MKIAPFNPMAEAIALDSREVVYTLRLCGDGLASELLCDVAWTTADEFYDHRWMQLYRSGAIYARPVVMTLDDYVRKHIIEIPALNPWCEESRRHFLACRAGLRVFGLREAS